MKYEVPEEEPMVVKEPVAYTGNQGITNALWTLIASQTQEVQAALRDKLNNMFSASHGLETYTREELNDRIDESEQQMKSGEVLSGEQVHNEMREYLNSLNV